jgi:T5SS/PEP-CTERM-associated repeat protein
VSNVIIRNTRPYFDEAFIMRNVFSIFYSPLALLAMSAALLLPASVVMADISTDGDVTPDPFPTVDPTTDPLIVGDVIVGDTSVGTLTIQTPAFTGPLNSTSGVIGNSLTGIGLAKVSGFAGDQSEWVVDTFLTVGLEGQGFLEVIGGGRVVTGSGTPDMEGEPTPFDEPDAILGEVAGGQGFVKIDGFASQFITTNELDVGLQGYGYLEVLDGGYLSTTFAFIGKETDSGVIDELEAIGRGDVLLNGRGTRWINSEELVIGDEGRGTLEIQNEATGRSLDTFIGVEAGSYGKVTVSDHNSLWWTEDTLEVGNPSIDAAQGELHVDNGALVRVDMETSIARGGLVEFDGGIFLTQDQSIAGISHAGVIRGDGRIESGITIAPTGEIRNAARTANLREKLLITGTVANDGIIESLGGEMEFESAVTSTGGIVTRDAIMRFQVGLISDGGITYGGASTMYGEIISSGKFLVLPDSSSVIIGSLSFAPSSLTEIAISAALGTLDVLGTASLDGLLQLDYAVGVGAQPGDSYQIFSASDGLSGEFSNRNDTLVAEGLLWDILYSSNTVTVTATDITLSPSGADFNGDGLVDQQDLLIWEDNFTTLVGAENRDGDADADADVDGNDFLHWQRQFGGPPPAVAAVAAVPEPAAGLLLVMGGLLLLTTLVRPLRLQPARVRAARVRR